MPFQDKTKESTSVWPHQLYNTEGFLYQNQNNNYLSPKSIKNKNLQLNLINTEKQAIQEGEGKLIPTKQTPNLTKQEYMLAIVMLTKNGLNYTINVQQPKWI